MTDEKLDLLLQKSLQSTEKAPEFHLVKKKTHVHRWISGLAAMCACAVLCVGVYIAKQDTFGYASSAPETAVMQGTATTTCGASEEKTESIVNDAAATEKTAAEAAPAEIAMGICKYPTLADVQAKKWMEENAPGQPYTLLAASERYCSYVCGSLYLVLERTTGETVPVQTLLQRCEGAAENVTKAYVNEKQELIWVSGTDEINLGYVE